MQNLENISGQIENIHSYFSDYANKQVNYAYTLRNWIIGMYLFKIEQKGQERAEYGDKLYKNIAERLKEEKIKGMSFTSLHTFKKFFQTYPSIVQLLPEEFVWSENQIFTIIQSATEQFELVDYGKKS
ncbi:DUF1016 N-terminal domain-containing protein [Flavobacterium sp.]|uniref:DUF1016 N-terminal domain-containing protein n=1 Tax=Flavobacterium sp. TaxID=239 RepID=UPI003753DB7D